MSEDRGSSKERKGGTEPARPVETEEAEYRVTVRKPKQDYRQDDPNRPLTKAERLSAWIQTGLLVAALAYTLVAGWQLSEFRKSVALTGTTFRTAQRAWVLFEQATVAPMNPGDTSILTTTRFRNYGEGPAIKARTAVVAIFGPPTSPEPDPFEYVHFSATASTSVVAPDANLSVQRRTEVPVGDVDGALAGTRKLYVIGIARYRDQFGVARKTTFCVYYRRDAKRLDNCHEHNEAT